MKIRSVLLLALSAAALPALAHDPAAHRRAATPAPAECAAFEGKDPATINLKDPAIKAQHDKCVAAKKAAKEAADAASKADHDH